MRVVARKVLLVLCMLVVTTAQLYSHAFAMPINMNSSSSAQMHSLHIMEINEGVSAAAESCGEQQTADALSDKHCSHMEKSSAHGCAEMSDCTQSQCVSPIDCGLSNYLFYLKTSVTTQVYNNHLLIDSNGASLYRPPIFR